MAGMMEDDSQIAVVSSTQIPHIVRRIVASGAGYSLVMCTSHQTVCPVAVLSNKQDVLEEPMAAFLTSKLGGIPVKTSP